MRILTAVKSCYADLEKGCHDTILQTWGAGIPDLRFFIGCSKPTWGKTWYQGFHVFSNSNDKTIDLDVADDYDHLPHKTKRIAEWSLEQGYDFIFLCDVDTFLVPSKLFKTNFQNFDYSGRFGTEHPIGKTFRFKDGRNQTHLKCHPWASGGFGYFLSRKAMAIVSETTPTLWAEDMYVGDTLGPKIQSGDVTAADLKNFENEASWHYPAHQLGWSRETMQAWMRGMKSDS